MDRYAGAFEEAVDGTRQQERHYQLLSALQSLVKELPRYTAAGWRVRSLLVLPALTAPLCPQLFPTAPVLHHAQRPGPGTPRRHCVRDRSGAAGDPAPHREEPVQPAPAAAERAPRCAGRGRGAVGRRTLLLREASLGTLGL